MQHDQDELNNVSRNVIRDWHIDDGEERLEKLVQRAARHYAEYMEPITAENQVPMRGPHDDIRFDTKES